MKIKELASHLNNHASEYEIGNLQDIRKKIRGLKRKPCSGIFSSQTIHQEYAFHVGGRSELQFNIGVGEDGNDQIRHGVAFALKPSQSFPDISILYPKIEKFNEYVISHLEDFSGFLMWSYPNGVRSEERPVGPIDNDWIKDNNFIMLGCLSNCVNLSIDEILKDFDRLLPLYEFVESQEYDRYIEWKCGEQKKENFKPVKFESGCPNFERRSTVSEHSEQVRNVALRHNKIQSVLYELLCQEVGENNVRIERPLPSGAKVDAAVHINQKERFYEVKVAGSVRMCLRAALGQLLEYAHWNSPVEIDKLIVVGECEANTADTLYLEQLRETYSLPIYYQKINIEDQILGILI